ncbi:MAG: hypothetical protein L6R48_16795 [Planctomycetes bacterium]|nr:hypothetical protein [Planctomycetota bacterium]
MDAADREAAAGIGLVAHPVAPGHEQEVLGGEREAHAVDGHRAAPGAAPQQAPALHRGGAALLARGEAEVVALQDDGVGGAGADGGGVHAAMLAGGAAWQSRARMPIAGIPSPAAAA